MIGVEKGKVLLSEYQEEWKELYKIERDKLFTIEDGWYRHDALKTGYLLFSYLMDGRK